MIVTWQFRIKDSGSTGRALAGFARSVNTIWNFCKETQITALRRTSARLIVDKETGEEVSIANFMTAFEFSDLAAGSSKLLGVHSQTVQAVCEEYARRRKQFKKMLRWRGKKSLGWVPWKKVGVKVRFENVREWKGPNGKDRSKAKGIITYCGTEIEFWASRVLPSDAAIKSGCFTQDASGRWYASITFESDMVALRRGTGDVGIDPGVKTMATTSDGDKIDGPRLRDRYLERIRRIERTRAYARRRQAKSKQFGKLPKAKQVANLHRKVANARNDHLHKESTALVERYERIFIGNVPMKLMNRSKTMAGVSLDHGTGKFKTLLCYKAFGAGGEAKETIERDSTRTCSACLHVGPRIGLGVREWTCQECGAIHDRDVNAARNILRLGRESLTRSHIRKSKARQGNPSPQARKR